MHIYIQSKLEVLAFHAECIIMSCLVSPFHLSFLSVLSKKKKKKILTMRVWRFVLYPEMDWHDIQCISLPQTQFSQNLPLPGMKWLMKMNEWEIHDQGGGMAVKWVALVSHSSRVSDLILSLGYCLLSFAYFQCLIFCECVCEMSCGGLRIHLNLNRIKWLLHMNKWNKLASV